MIHPPDNTRPFPWKPANSWSLLLELSLACEKDSTASKSTICTIWHFTKKCFLSPGIEFQSCNDFFFLQEFQSRLFNVLKNAIGVCFSNFYLWLSLLLRLNFLTTIWIFYFEICMLVPFPHFFLLGFVTFFNWFEIISYHYYYYYG